MIRKILSVFLVVCLLCSVSVAPATAAAVELAEPAAKKVMAGVAAGVAAESMKEVVAEKVMAESMKEVVARMVENHEWMPIDEVNWDAVEGFNGICGAVLTDGALGFVFSVAGTAAMLVVEIVVPPYLMKKYNLQSLSPIPSDCIMNEEVLLWWINMGGRQNGNELGIPSTGGRQNGNELGIPNTGGRRNGNDLWRLNTGGRQNGNDLEGYRLPGDNYEAELNNSHNFDVYYVAILAAPPGHRNGYMLVPHGVAPPAYGSVTREGVQYQLTIHDREGYFDHPIPPINQRYNFTMNRKIQGPLFSMTQSQRGIYLLIDYPYHHVLGYVLFPVFENNTNNIDNNNPSRDEFTTPPHSPRNTGGLGYQ